MFTSTRWHTRHLTPVAARMVSRVANDGQTLVKPLELFMKVSSQRQARIELKQRVMSEQNEGTQALLQLIDLERRGIEKHRNHWKVAIERINPHISVMRIADIVKLLEVACLSKAPHFHKTVDHVLKRITLEIGTMDLATTVTVYTHLTDWAGSVSEVGLRLLEQEVLRTLFMRLDEAVKSGQPPPPRAHLIDLFFMLVANQERRRKLRLTGKLATQQRQMKLKDGGETFTKDLTAIEERFRQLEEEDRASDMLANSESLDANSNFDGDGLTHAQVRTLLSYVLNWPMEGFPGYGALPASEATPLIRKEDPMGGSMLPALPLVHAGDVGDGLTANRMARLFFCAGWAMQRGYLKGLESAPMCDGWVKNEEAFANRARRLFNPDVFAVRTSINSNMTSMQGTLVGGGDISAWPVLFCGLDALGLSDRPVVQDLRRDCELYLTSKSLKTGLVAVLREVSRLGLWNSVDSVWVEGVFRRLALYSDSMSKQEKAEIVLWLDEAIDAMSHHAADVSPAAAGVADKRFKTAKMLLSKRAKRERLDVATLDGLGVSRGLIVLRNTRVFERVPRDQAKWSKWEGLEEDARRG